MINKTKEELDSIKENLKGQYTPLYTLEIPVGDEIDNESRTIFLRKYDRPLLSAFQKVIVNGGDSFKASEMFLKGTYVGGDDLNEIINDLDMLRSCEGSIMELINVRRATLKKN